jgi:hypothetical protein
MEEFRLTLQDKQDARTALLKYYSSKCLAHGTYLVAIAVAFYGFVKFVPFILDPTLNITILPLTTELTKSIMVSLPLSGFIALTVYVLGRTFFWSHLTTAILNVKPKEKNEVEYEPEQTTVTFLQQLHIACFDYVEHKHKISAKICRLGFGYLTLIWIDLSVMFIIFSLVLLYLR